jgi:hypothetical protein
MNTLFKHKEIHKFTWEARGHKSITDYFITNMKTLLVFQDTKVYRNSEIDSNHYLLCAKSKFSTTMVKQEQQKGPIKAGRNLQSKIVNR